jgi:O-antigen/teichoic acid export membrane protein
MRLCRKEARDESTGRDGLTFVLRFSKSAEKRTSNHAERDLERSDASHLRAETEDCPAPPDHGGFRTVILQAAGWSMGGYVASQFLRIFGNLILTRLLVPEMFGLMAVATMVQIIIFMLSDIGLRQAVVQSARGDSRDFLDTAWTLQAIRGFLIWLVCIAVALGFALASHLGALAGGSVYTSPELTPVIIIVAFTSVISGFQSTNLITRARHLDLGRVTAIETFSQVLGLVVAILLAWLTRSIWSLVASALVSSIALTVLSHTHLAGSANRFRLESKATGELLRFGRWVMLSSTFSVLASNGDRILLAAWISQAALGLYVLAYSLVAILEGAGGRLFTSVASPTLSRVAREQPETLRSVYYKFRIPFDMFFVGGAGLLYASGEAIIGVLYDARYAGAATVLQILSCGLLVSRFTVFSLIYLALNEPRYLSLLNIAKAVCLFTIVPLCYWLFDFEGALWAIALHALPTVPVIVYFNEKFRLNSLLFEIAIMLLWPVGYGLGRVVLYALKNLSGLEILSLW